MSMQVVTQLKQLDMELVTPDVGTIFWMLLMFILVLVILKKFAWKPILNALDNREKTIEESLRSADRAREEMEQLKADNEKIMAKARMKPGDFDYVIFHQPNGKFPFRVGAMLGFAKEQIEPGWLVSRLGNTYSGSSPLGLTATLDIAKRLLDFGFHAPTVYFPLVVPEALMIEPTETETVETLDRFASVMRKIAHEAESEPDMLKSAPHDTPVGRIDEARAARELVIAWPE